MNNANDKYDVFVGYEKYTGESYAENLKDALEKYGFKVFLAREEIRAGKNFENEIFTALKKCKYFVVIITSLTPKSEWVKKECEKALKLNKRIVPCRWKDVKIEETEKITEKLSKIQQIEFENKSELANKVIGEIKKIETKEAQGIYILKDVEELLNRGNLLIWLKEYDEAIKFFEKAIEIKPDYIDALINKGVVLAKLQRYEKALEVYEKALKINPEDPFAWFNKGVTLGKLKRYEEELKTYENTIKITPTFAEAWYNKSCIYSQNGDKENALKNLTRAIELDAKFKEEAKRDEDFKNLWDDEDFKKIVG